VKLIGVRTIEEEEKWEGERREAERERSVERDRERFEEGEISEVPILLPVPPCPCC
jgi:hypothetical protein